MGLIAKNDGNTIERLQDGVYTAVSTMLIDLGIQNNERFGKRQRKVIIVWQILGEDVEINGEKKPRIISKEYTLSLNEKSTLRRDLQAWRGQAFTLEELDGFDLVNILNQPCQLQILSEERNGNSYQNIAAIMAMPKGMTVDSGADEVVYFNTYEQETYSNFEKIPKWIQEKIRKCENQKETGLDVFLQKYDKEHPTQETMQQTSQPGQKIIDTAKKYVPADFIPQDGLPF